MLTRLEDLPNELFFNIFSYLNGLNLYLAFSNLNTRINRLLDDVSSYQSLDLTSGSVSYNAFRAYINDQNGVRSSFISSLKFNCLSLSPFGIEDLFSSFINTSITNRLLRLTLITDQFATVTTIDIVTFLEQLMIANKHGRGRLEHLILEFEYCDHYYAKILMIIQRNISFHTMILNVTSNIAHSALSRRMAASSNETNLHITIDARPLLRNTVCLSLSLECCSDLVLILQRRVSPLLQQLSVTFKCRKLYIDCRSVRFKVDESNLLTTDTSQLRTLSLRNLAMRYALRFLRLTQLETLRLINIPSSTFRYISDFERAISIRLYNLITFQFILRFPIDILPMHDLHSSKDLSILQNDAWQSRGWFVRDHIDTEQKNLIIYTVPYALSDDRSLRNHTFIAAQQPHFVDLKAHQLLLWTAVDPNPSRIAQSLKGFSQARHLKWTFEARVSPLVLSSLDNVDSMPQWSPMQLRSLCLFISGQIPIKDRANMITQMLFVCRHLRTLVARSAELALCLRQKPSATLPSLDRLHLYLDVVTQGLRSVLNVGEAYRSFSTFIEIRRSNFYQSV